MNSYKYKVQDSSSVGEIRRQAQVLAFDLGLSEVELEHISIVINELASNLLKHAREGIIILAKRNNCLQILSLDKGPGMANVNECLRDGYSTQGTQGTGLGAIKRLSFHFDIYTVPGKGTAIYSSFKASNCADVCDPNELGVELGYVSIPYPGEQVCGDGWTLVAQSLSKYRLLVCDGLGHGLLAHEAATAAISSYQAVQSRAPLADIDALHLALRSTRGAAVASAEIDFETHKVNYAGLGNISGTIVELGSSRKLISYNGTAGLQMRKVQAMSYPMENESLLIMHSDGLSFHWDLRDYPGLLFRHPMLVAGVLYRDYNRDNDDATIVVVRKLT